MNLIFYKCPGICITEMDGMTKAFKKINKEIGKDFEVVTISIDPRELSQRQERRDNGPP